MVLRTISSKMADLIFRFGLLDTAKGWGDLLSVRRYCSQRDPVRRSGLAEFGLGW